MSEGRINPKKKWRRVAVAILFIVVAWLVSWCAARWLIVEAPLERADAIVVLSGSSTYAERAQMAATLFRAGKANHIILTNDNRQGGWSSAEQRNPFFYERAKRELQRQGVPEADIEVIMQPVSSTRDEAERMRQYAATHQLSALLIVTSPYHSRRALRTFQRTLLGLNIQVGIAHPEPGFQSPPPSRWWLRPRGWQMVPYEYLKLAYYWLMV